MCHCPVFGIIFFLICFKGVQKENGIVHCYTKLKYCCQRFCDITNLTKENVASQIINNCKTYTKQEQHRNYQRIHSQKQNQQRQAGCDHNIDWHFLKCYILNVCYDTGHPTYKALFICNLTHIGNCFHRRIRRCCIIKKRDHHGCITIEEAIFELSRDHTYRNA